VQRKREGKIIPNRAAPFLNSTIGGVPGKNGIALD
jgi:hypothetical protein